MVQSDEMIKEVCDGEDVGNILKDPVLDEETQQFIEMEDYVDKQNKKRLDALKEGIRCAALKIDNYQENVERFYDSQPFFYDLSGLFWFWNITENRWQMIDEVDIMNSLDAAYNFQGMTIPASVKNNYLEAFKRVGRHKKPKDAPVKWIQFKDKAYSITASKVYNVTPDFFFTNPIPWEMGVSSDTPIMDSLFKEWVGPDYVPMLYEIIAYCCYTEYPIQLIFCLYGAGRNGKTCYQRLIYKFLGIGNICSTELDVLTDSNFEAFKLYKKLACFMGETNYGTMAKSTILKKLVGGDMIEYQKKYKDPFDAQNYAKMIIASNSLPPTNDNTDGFYRRWNIISFPNEFPEGKDILKTIPEQEYNNLARKVTEILPGLLERGKFTNQGEIEERKHNYMMASNPLPIFVKLCCNVDGELYGSYNELYTAYLKFLRAHKNRRVSMKEFRAALEDEGFWVERTSKKYDDESWKSGNWVIGVELKPDYVNYVNLHKIPYNFSTRSDFRENNAQITQITQKDQEIKEERVE